MIEVNGAEMRERGFSLIEVVVASFILFIVLTLILASWTDTARSIEVSELRSRLANDAQVAERTAVRQVQGTGLQDEADLAVAASEQWLQFRTLVDMTDPETLTWSDLQRAGFAFEADEASGGTILSIGGADYRIDGTASGADDDGDGLVDEGILFYQRRVDDPGSARVLLEGVLPQTGTPIVRLTPGGGNFPSESTQRVRFECRAFARTHAVQPDSLVDAGTPSADATGFVSVDVEFDVTVRNRSTSP